jgi:hypothetical protein
MKILNALLVCSILLSSTTIGFAQTETPGAAKPSSPTMAFGLLDGTPIKVRITRTVSSKDAKTGDTVDFEVLEDVKVADVIVVPKGGIALGTVTNAKPSGRMGRGGKLDIVIDHVRLIDGEKVALRAVKESKGGSHTGVMTGAIVASAILFFPAAPLFLLMKGKNITVPKGTEITAYVNGDTSLDPKQFGSAGLGGNPNQPIDPSGASSIVIKSDPSGADIEIDGKFAGSTPSTLQLKIGEHRITIKKSGFVVWERTLDMTAGGGVVIDASLEKAP